MKLFEVSERIKLSSTEEGILAVIFNSANTREAFNNINGTQQLVVSRKILQNYGLIKINGNSVNLTREGEEVMVKYNLIENGTITQYGKDVISKFIANTNRWKTIF